MKISARNQIEAGVLSVNKGAVNAKIALRAPKGTTLSAIITIESVESLDLAVGDVVRAFFKASHVLIATGGMPKISARNKLAGRVEKVIQGAVNTELIIQLESGDLLTSIITNESMAELGIGLGSDVIAIVKASDVMIAK
ncbi:TOBE domain-containing protein [Sulfurimonas sp. HSL-3221]|uniref:TOBE domain-containing protein n=1 Tax=Sulfurimonadaceae TaxID=2771471 RepID=UPI001E57AE80|nr:TOBE domain-containing protein [Sulfurimonas sp. HSL-3221]UFS61851.1 TOBE domain-containing protein [Sulfurimonas sp. HSL-3221]